MVSTRSVTFYIVTDPGGICYIEKEIIKIFKAAGDYPNCEASRRIQDNISDMQAQSAANAVGGELPPFFVIERCSDSLSQLCRSRPCSRSSVATSSLWVTSFFLAFDDG